MTTCHHYHVPHPRLRGVRLNPKDASDFPDGTLSPEQILIAYGFRKGQYAGAAPIKLGIGSLGGGVVQADIDASVAAWKMVAPNVTIRTVGRAQDDPSDQESNVENMLDLVPTMAFCWQWLTGQPADITICFGPNQGNGMELVTNDLVAAGCQVVSWSWGSAASGWDPQERVALAAAFAAGVAKGVTFCAASGDNSIDDSTSAPSADYPSSDPNVWGVGGTLLKIAANGSRAAELAWGDGNPGDSGGGGGYDPSVPVPSFQQGVIPATASGRGAPDTSANGDPNSGWQMSANGSWTVVGGTSAASPFTACLIAIAKGLAAAVGHPTTGMLLPTLYANRKTACNDITVGSNGAPAVSGWDRATGNGSPNGPSFIDALVRAMP